MAKNLTAKQLDKLLKDFVNKQAEQLQKVPTEFVKQVEAIQQEIFNNISQLVAALERNGDDIAMTTGNAKLAESISSSIKKILADTGYSDALAEYIAGFQKQKSLINDFLQTSFGEFNEKTGTALFELTKKNAAQLLSSTTVTTKFLDPLSNQIDIAIQSGQNFSKTVKQIREFALGKADSLTGVYNKAGAERPGNIDKNNGKILQYSKQISYDSMAISDRAYTNAIASELESEWYFYAGGLVAASRVFCQERVGKYFHRNEIKAWANLVWQGKAENTDENNIFLLLGGHNCQHTLIPVSIDQVPASVIQRNLANGNYVATKADQPVIDAKQQEVVDEFPRQEVSGEDVKVQEDSIRYFVDNQQKLVSDYIDENGNNANTDLARKFFDVVGYKGTNAVAVQEAASALNKLVIEDLVANGTTDKIVMLAGGSGAGKTSAIESLFKNIAHSADVLIDGNMSKYGSSFNRIDSLLNLGKTVDIKYVYREPVEAWLNGVIKRMLENPTEGGRVVPLRVFLENTKGSYDTVKRLLQISGRDRFNINLLDNSLGRGNTAIMDIEKFNNLKFDKALKDLLIEETKKLLEAGKITQAQFDALIYG